MLLRKSQKLSHRQADRLSQEQPEILPVNYSIVKRIAKALLNFGPNTSTNTPFNCRKLKPLLNFLIEQHSGSLTRMTQLQYAHVTISDKQA